MNRVKRAIIMAAGKGKRMNPITLVTPKPLINVNGQRMIDTIIDGLHQNGINEIYIVIGYLKEKFYDLKNKYPELKFIDNPYYETCNNISSLFVARDFIEDSIILDGDQIIFNDSILSREFERSGYSCVWSDKYTDEWLLTVSDNIITNCNRTGGEKGWQLFGISRWSSEDGKKLKKHLEVEFEIKKNQQIYWDDVALFCYFREYKLGIIEIQYGDIIEIDSLKELVAIDKSFEKYLNGEIYDEIKFA